MAELHPLADIHADPLVMGVLNGDRSAWFRLTLHIEDWVEEHAPRHWRMRKARLARSEDDVRDVLLETLERVDRDDFRALRQYLEQKLRAVPDVRALSAEPLSFVSWLAGLVDFAIREHVRRRYGRAPARAEQAPQAQPSAPLSKRSLQSWAIHPSEAEDHESDAPSLSRIVTARSILSYAEAAFDERELSFFRRYLEHANFEELAEEFALARPELARLQIRKLKERLRARFRDDQ